MALQEEYRVYLGISDLNEKPLAPGEIRGKYGSASHESSLEDIIDAGIKALGLVGVVKVIETDYDGSEPVSMSEAGFEPELECATAVDACLRARGCYIIESNREGRCTSG